MREETTSLGRRTIGLDRRKVRFSIAIRVNRAKYCTVYKGCNFAGPIVSSIHFIKS